MYKVRPLTAYSITLMVIMTMMEFTTVEKKIALLGELFSRERQQLVDTSVNLDARTHSGRDIG